mmetsp:Transcript_70972/g.123091  ORF Transcript_70972/g.123091 Transcript_70972/m.123091 type:complete len:808 (+) Transcript_70972:84-2507(+)
MFASGGEASSLHRAASTAGAELLVSGQGGEASKVTQAVIWAEHARKASSCWVESCQQSQLEWYILMKRTSWLTTMAKCTLLLLTIFEEPSVCTATAQACEAEEVQKFYSMHVARLPPRVSNSIALACWLVLLGRMWLQSKALGNAYHLGWISRRQLGSIFLGFRYPAFSFWHALGGVVIALGIFSTIVALTAAKVMEFAVILRPIIYICVTREIRKSFAQIARTIPGYVMIIVSLFLCVFVFVWIGMVLFFHTGKEETVDFRNWGYGAAKMWIYFTTSNSPDVFIPSYNKNRAYIIFWITYFTVTMYLLSNVLLAKVYDEYARIMKNQYKAENIDRLAALQRTWALLSNESEIIEPHTWEQFFIQYCDSSIGGITVEDDDMKYNMWRAHVVLDLFYKEKFLGTLHDGEGRLARGLTESEFKTIMKIFFDRNLYIPRRSPPRATSAWHKFFAKSNYLVECGWVKLDWEILLDMVVLMGVLLTFAQTILFLRKGVSSEDALVDKPTFWTLCVFSLFYVFSNLAKLYAFGLERYWYKQPFKSRFESLISVAILTVEFMYIFLFRDVACERAILLLHMAKGAHLLGYIAPFYQLWLILDRILPDFWQMIQVLLLVYYFFATIGQWFFGGLIYKGNPALTGSLFAQNYYYSLNFNDLLSGFVVMFVLMVVNNWMVIAGGYLLVTRAYYGHAWYACGFFVSFFVVCNLIILNILVALILNHPDLGDTDEAQDQLGLMHSKHSEAKIRTMFLDETDVSSSGSSTDRESFYDAESQVGHTSITDYGTMGGRTSGSAPGVAAPRLDATLNRDTRSV